jgi:hypothetical protein
MEFTFSVSSSANLSFMGNTPWVGYAKPDSLHGHSRRCYPPICAPSKTRYNPSIASKKGVIGCESPLEFAAKSRNRTVCGFLFGTSYGGADGRAQALPVSLRELPGLSTHQHCRPI